MQKEVEEMRKKIEWMKRRGGAGGERMITDFESQSRCNACVSVDTDEDEGVE